MVSARPLTPEERKQAGINALLLIGKILLCVLLFPFVLLYFVLKASTK